MIYDSVPFYPSMTCEGDADACVRVPMFKEARRGTGPLPDTCQYRRVTIENPCRPGERAEVLLGVDACGNLVVCVRKDPCRSECPARPPRPCPPPPPPCPCPPRPARLDGGRGRLYGSWR